MLRITTPLMMPFESDAQVDIPKLIEELEELSSENDTVTLEQIIDHLRENGFEEVAEGMRQNIESDDRESTLREGALGARGEFFDF